MSETNDPNAVPLNVVDGGDPNSYVEGEIAEAQKSLRNLKIFGSVVVALLSLETIVVTAKFCSAMQPQNAATIAAGFALSQVDDHSDDIQQQITERVPAMVDQSPDYMISQMPSYREALEGKITDNLNKYCQDTSADLGKRMDAYLIANKDQMQTVMLSANNPAVADQLGKELKTAMIAYLNDKPDNGTSVNDQINDSLHSVQSVGDMVHHLANSPNLTPDEQKTKRAIAVILKTVKAQNLQPISLKDAIAQS